MTPDHLHYARLGRAEREDHEALRHQMRTDPGMTWLKRFWSWPRSRFDLIVWRAIVVLTGVGLVEVAALVWLRGY